MIGYIIQVIAGLIGGLILSITGIPATGLIILLFEYLGIGNYKSNLGAILFMNLFPITIGSFYEFYKAKQINFTMAFILLFSFIIGGYFGSKLVVGKKYELSKKTMKYISCILGFTIALTFLYSAINEDE